MSTKRKPRPTLRRVGAPSGIFMQISRDEWLRARSAVNIFNADTCTFTLSPLDRTVCVHWASPEHILCDAAMLYPSHIDILLEPGVVDEAVRLAAPEAVAEFYYACERFNEFDALVVESVQAREHILSIQPVRSDGLAVITRLHHRVRVAVAAAAARRAVEEIIYGC